MDPDYIRIPRNHTAWTSFDKELIEFVKENPVIYNPSVHQSKAMKRSEAVYLLWNRFGQKAGCPAHKIATRWKSILDIYKKILKNPRKGSSTSKYLDGRLSFLGLSNGSSRISESPPVINLSDDDDAVESVSDVPAETADIKLQTTILTRNLIEELLAIKSNEAGVSSRQTNIEWAKKNEGTIGAVPVTRMETNYPVAEVVKSSDDILNSANENVVFDGHNEYLPIKVENDEINTLQDNSTTNKTLSNQHDKGASKQYGISTTDSFMEMGSYVIGHFSEEKQKELRKMLWALIQEELQSLKKH